MNSFPRIVCLCGSTRFMDQFHEANYQHTMAGEIVLSVGVNTKAANLKDSDAGGPGSNKAALDQLHLRKIDLADYIYVLNVDGYIGDSTKNEIAYAIFLGKPIEFYHKALGEHFLGDKAHEIGDLVAKHAMAGINLIG